MNEMQVSLLAILGALALGVSTELTIAPALAAATATPTPHASATATATSNPCSSTVATSSVSPDGAWIAVLADNVCEANYAFMSAAYWSVTVVSKSKPSNSGVVFSYDDDGNTQSKPSIKWTGAEALQITAAQKLGTNTEASSFSTVAVSYVFTH